MLSREEINKLKEKYPAGTKIRLHNMEREMDMPSGLEGEVYHVDDIGQIHMKWENGRTLPINTETDSFSVITQAEEQESKQEHAKEESKMNMYIDKVNAILKHVDFGVLNISCNLGKPNYAQNVLLDLHKAFEEVYGTDYVDPENEMVLMPAVIKGDESGIQTLALVTIDLMSAGEHWGTIFFTPGGILEQGDPELTDDQKRAISEHYMPYSYWYTPLVERDIHVNFDEVPESVRTITKLVDEYLSCENTQTMNTQQ